MKSTEFIANDNAIYTMQCSSPDTREGQIRRHEHGENAKKVTKIDWQDEVNISENYTKNPA